MSTRAPYRNAIRSKQLIRASFLNLLEEKDITLIKVKEIIELANISKGTFYAHYDSIYGVLEEIEIEYINRIEKIFYESHPFTLFEDLLPMWLKSLKTFENDKKFFTLLVRSSRGDLFFNHLEIMLTNYLLSDETVAKNLKSKQNAYGYLAFALGGALVILKKWFTISNDISSEEMAVFLNSCIMDGIKSIKIS